jgi:AcrR family transcriptional regulator
MGDVDDPPRARRTGGRSARVYAAVLKATVAVLYERGFDALSIGEVAERSEVHESSIYRRWATKADLVLDALLSRARLEIPVPDTGSLREDLLAWLRALAAFLGSPVGLNLARLGLRNDLPEFDAVRDEFLNDRFTRAAAILDRAADRGELRASVDRILTVETLIGLLLLRLLLTREPITESVLAYAVDLVLAGIALERP